MHPVSSLGGPRVMLPSSEIMNWIHELGDSPTPDTGLYQLACSIDEYCGVIQPWGTPLVIFGDDPADIYYSCSTSKDCSLLYRWIAAESLEQLTAFARKVVDADQWDEALSLTITDSKMTLMDACTHVGDTSPRIELNLRTGPHTLHSRYAESSEVATIVHCLRYAG